MGYYTSFTFNSEPELPEDFITPLFIEATDNYWESIENVYELDWMDRSKWYEYDKHMTKLSIMLPDVLFILDGVGEESHDIWRTFYLNGKLECHEAEDWIPPSQPKDKYFGWTYEIEARAKETVKKLISEHVARVEADAQAKADAEVEAARKQAKEQLAKIAEEFPDLV